MARHPAKPTRDARGASGCPVAPRASGPAAARSLQRGRTGVNRGARVTLNAVEEALGYDETLTVLRRSLVVATGNAQAFGIRARGRPRLLSARGWAELAEIERLLALRLTDSLRRELRVAASSGWGRTQATWRGLAGGLASEPGFVARLFHEVRAQPVERWRAGAPQLESSLWPFFCARTRYLVNTLALSLNEPAPHPALFWHPGAREFRDASRR